LKPIFLLSPTPLNREGLIHIPTIEIEYLDIYIDFSNIDYLIFTSKQGIRSIDRLSPQWKNIPALVVGQKSSDEVERLGGKILEIGKGYGAGLVDVIKSKYGNYKFLYIRPEKVISDFGSLPNVREVITYRTRCKNSYPIPPNSIVIASSPSVVKCLLKREIPNNTIFVAIGETTAKTIPAQFQTFTSSKRDLDSCYKLAKELANSPYPK